MLRIIRKVLSYTFGSISILLSVPLSMFTCLAMVTSPTYSQAKNDHISNVLGDALKSLREFRKDTTNE